MEKLNSLLQSVKPFDFEVEELKKKGRKEKPEKTEKSELEILVHRKQNEMRKKAQYHWSLLRESVCSVRKAVEESDLKNLVITHGIHRERKMNHHKKITQVLYIPQHKEYLTCDGQNFRFFHEDGRKKDIVDTEEGMNRVIYSNQTNQFVGWVHGQEDLYLMSREFVIGSQSKAVGKILMGTYNNNTGELITVGPNFITCWAFRYGARHLIPRKTTKTNFGERKMFKMMVLEETASKSQRIFFAQGTGVVVFNVYSGLEMCHKRELHAQPVTAITFFNPLKYVITGAQDGCIKVWDSQWRVQMVFVGHNGQVNHLKIYPHGPAFISASLDCTIRVWNMETCDEIDKTVISEPIEGIGTEMNYDIFYTFAGRRVDLWKLQHLFQIHTNIGYRINAIQVTNHPAHPVRAVLLCRDSSIRLVCPTNGEVITTLLMKPAYGLVDAAYAIAEDTLFALLGNGDIVKSRTDQNPCQIVSRWKCDNPREMCNYLLVYEYVVDPTESGDIWAMMKRSVATKTVQVVGDNTTGSSAPGSSNKNRTLLLGGRKDGYICVFDWHTGEVTFKVEAHGSKGVLNMIANSKADQLVSAGMDNIIKVWRLYPFAQEALAPLMSFYCAHTPSFMTTIKSSMGVAFQDPSTATFSVVLYSLPEKTQENKLLGSLGHRNDHKPDDDHMDIITGLTCCPRMKLYASCSMDGTIRIWSNENVLVRLLKINTIPHSIAFCSPKGDLLVGLSNHLFFISHTKYLPKSYLRKQVCMRFGRERSELPLAFDDNKINTMEKNDVKRLKNSHASFKFTHFVDILSAEEQEEVMREKQIRAEAYGQLEIRENELQQIRDGALTTKHKFKGNKKTQNRAFREYMKMYYNKPREKLPLDEETGVTLAKQQAAEKDSDDEEDDTYRPDTAPYGFFSELSHSGTSPGEEPCYPSGPSGYLPNSVLVKILYPPPPPTPASRDATPYQPPVLTPGQLAEIQSLHSKKFGRRDSELDISAVSRNVTFAADDHLTRVLELELSDEEDKKAADPDSAEPPEATTSFEFDESMRGQIDSANASSGGAATIATPARSSAMTVRTFSDLPDSRPLTTPKTPAKSRLSRKKTKSSFFDESDEDDDDMFGGMSQKSTSLMSKFQEIMDEPPPPKIQEEPMEGAEPTVKVKELDEAEEPEEPTPSPVKRPPAGLSKPITKLISRPPPKAATPPPPRSPTPPPPPTPLPNFIKQFVGAEWFDKYFPNCNENTMPKPWTADVFVNMIVKLIRIADFVHKVGVVDAILSVHAQEGLSGNVEAVVVKTLLAVLNHHTNPPSCAQPDQRNFILASLRALTVFGIKDKDVLAELMVQFLDGDKDVRSQVVEVLTNLGLVDPHKQFQKELDSWDIWSIDEKNHLDELHKMSNQWLDRWMASYKMRIKDTVEKLQQGHSLHGRLSNRGSMAPGASRRGSMMPGDNETVTSLPGGSLKIPDTARTGRMSSMSHSSVTVTLDRLQGSSILESVSYLDAITYFCEMMTEKELEALRRGETLRGGGSDKVVQAKNTVLVLPKIQHKPALVRLGEMHTSKCRPERETALHTDFRMPPISTRGGFVSAINLPMKPVYLNPFPCAIDDFEPYFQQPVLITLKSSQKYFIPAQSYVPLEEHVAVGT
ncbi:WD repeat-containing protein kiaa1875-like isoform x3 [Plakobranchus ocellatus]|uniref:WD repeat-containing protein kiaa1875-like isoform x3 n=1 Tax=Plakobranchus ocellatus TaxID=259542 RepID=A0AAV3XWE9_9GAST|nr:WD repeat-containing protein kiaa1875-like isoform x3 [Plakobranchus ocellatus]